MSNPLALIASLVALGVLYVMLPTFILALREYQGVRRVRCPESGQEADITLAAGRAALAQLFGPPRLRIATCSLWPALGSCSQRCARA